MNLRTLVCVVVALLCQIPAYANSVDIKFKAEVALESRQFDDDNDALTEDTGTSLFARVDTVLSKGSLKFALRAFTRVDPQDHERDLSAFEELFVSWERSQWRIRAGYQMLNWTATEAFHPADVVNSRNFDSHIENPEKLGELMVSLRRRIGLGSVEAYLLPRMERPKLPGSRSRLSFAPPGVELGTPRWLDEDGLTHESNWRLQWGVRWAAVLGDADISLHVLDHQDRQQPVIVFDPAIGLSPSYAPVVDVGATYLHILGGSLVKLEVGHKDFKTDAQKDHTQVALGYEYGWVVGNGAQATFIAEAQNYFGVAEHERAALGIFQRDLLLGYRHAFNDMLGRELLVTWIADLERDHEFLINMRYSQRLNDTWSIETGFRLVDAPVKNQTAVGLESLDGANQIFVNLRRYF